MALYWDQDGPLCHSWPSTGWQHKLIKGDLGRLLSSIKKCELIILDEISFIDGWDRAIKHFIDGGYDGILCVSGSHAYDLEL